MMPRLRIFGRSLAGSVGFIVGGIVVASLFFIFAPQDAEANRSGLPWNSGVSPGSGAGDPAMNNVTNFGTWRHRPVDVGIVFIGKNGWSVASGGSYAKMATNESIAPSGAVKRFLDAGIIPVMTVPMVISTDAGKFAYVAAGNIDTEHETIAARIAAVTTGRLIYLRVGHEADEGYPWSYTGHDGPGQPDPANPADYKAAWRRIAQIYKTNVPGSKIVWNVLKNTRQAIADYYPGDDVVDVISIDPYDNGSGGFCDSLANWQRTCLGSYNASTGVSKGIGGLLAFAKIHSKKIAVDEWGASNGKFCPPGGTTVIDSKTVCALDPLNGANNDYYVAAMYDFFAANSGWIEYESYFNRAGRDDGFGGEHQVFPRVAHNGKVSDMYFTKYAGEAPEGTTDTTGTIGTTGTTGTTVGSVGTGIVTGGPGPIRQCYPQYTAASAIPPRYGAAFNLFNGGHELILDTTCTDIGTAVDVTGGSAVGTQYVYKTGYRWNGTGWAAVTFTGTELAADPDWLIAPATVSIPKDQLGVYSGGIANFIAAYTCQVVASQMKCGCFDIACVDTSGNRWQLQRFTKPATRAGTVTGIGVGTAGTTGTGTTGGPDTVATPVFNPYGGYFDPTVSVTITDATPGASIYYTLDGTEPTAASTLYAGAFTLNATTTAKAIGIKTGMPDSPVATALFYKGKAPKGGSGFVGKSGMPWNAGQWINGGSDRIAQYTAWMGHESDAVTQGMGDVTIWPNVGGADSEAEVDQDFNRTPAQWNTNGPLFHGVFQDAGWFKHIWGGFPATEARKRIINLDWAEPIPSTVGNKWNGSNYANPTLYKDIKLGAADKYIFLLGRKFAWLDQRDGDPAFPMTLDFFYEFTLETHGKSPEGSYTDATGKHFTYQDFPYAWARWIRVFKNGYAYQRGRQPNYLVAFRPQLRFLNSDRRGGGSTIRHEQVWPNNVAGWDPGNRVINGVTVLSAGPIGKTIDLVGASWHDSSMEHVKGSSATAPGNNWAKILGGSDTYWGFNEIAAFARAQGVRMVFPEWAPRREGNFSPYAADVIRFSHSFFNANKDILDHEDYFDQGDGSIYQDWPNALPGQDPRPVYRAMWNGH